MSEADDFDALLKARFDAEHQHVPADPFIAIATRRIRAESRRMVIVRNTLRVAVLVAAVIASPWLIEGASRLNAALESSLAWGSGLPGAWMLGVLVVAALLVSRARSS
ncbi:MAG: hypothetical protein WDO12_11220 [Pseudomonadota bacterium]